MEEIRLNYNTQQVTLNGLQKSNGAAQNTADTTTSSDIVVENNVSYDLSNVNQTTYSAIRDYGITPPQSNNSQALSTTSVINISGKYNNMSISELQQLLTQKEAEFAEIPSLEDLIANRDLKLEEMVAAKQNLDLVQQQHNNPAVARLQQIDARLDGGLNGELISLSTRIQEKQIQLQGIQYDIDMFTSMSELLPEGEDKNNIDNYIAVQESAAAYIQAEIAQLTQQGEQLQTEATQLETERVQVLTMIANSGDAEIINAAIAYNDARNAFGEAEQASRAAISGDFDTYYTQLSNDITDIKATIVVKQLNSNEETGKTAVTSDGKNVTAEEPEYVSDNRVKVVRSNTEDDKPIIYYTNDVSKNAARTQTKADVVIVPTNAEDEMDGNSGQVKIAQINADADVEIAQINAEKDKLIEEDKNDALENITRMQTEAEVEIAKIEADAVKDSNASQVKIAQIEADAGTSIAKDTNETVKYVSDNDVKKTQINADAKVASKQINAEKDKYISDNQLAAVLDTNATNKEIELARIAAQVLMTENANATNKEIELAKINAYENVELAGFSAQVAMTGLETNAVKYVSDNNVKAADKLADGLSNMKITPTFELNQNINNGNAIDVEGAKVIGSGNSYSSSNSSTGAISVNPTQISSQDTILENVGSPGISNTNSAASNSGGNILEQTNNQQQQANPNYSATLNSAVEANPQLAAKLESYPEVVATLNANPQLVSKVQANPNLVAQLAAEQQTNSTLTGGNATATGEGGSGGSVDLENVGNGQGGAGGNGGNTTITESGDDKSSITCTADRAVDDPFAKELEP